MLRHSESAHTKWYQGTGNEPETVKDLFIGSTSIFLIEP